jgi:hypothetical protein
MFRVFLTVQLSAFLVVVSSAMREPSPDIAGEEYLTLRPLLADFCKASQV